MHAMPTTQHLSQSHQWICSNYILDKVNAAGAQSLLKLNVKKTKLMTIGDVPDHITIRVNNDPVEKVKQFKYLCSLKSTDGDCSKNVNARIAMAKRRMCEPTTLWKDRSIPVALKMRLVKTLVWTVLSYGAEAWTVKVRDERKITSMEMWFWRRRLRICWMEKRTDNSIIQELEIKRELLGTSANANCHTLDTYAETTAAR